MFFAAEFNDFRITYILAFAETTPVGDYLECWMKKRCQFLSPKISVKKELRLVTPLRIL